MREEEEGGGGRSRKLFSINCVLRLHSLLAEEEDKLADQESAALQPRCYHTLFFSRSRPLEDPEKKESKNPCLCCLLVMKKDDSPLVVVAPLKKVVVYMHKSSGLSLPRMRTLHSGEPVVVDVKRPIILFGAP